MKYLVIFQIVVALMLIAAILLQNRGTGLGAAFGGDSGGYYAKRGMEKFLVHASVVLAIAFVVLAGVNTFGVR